MKISPIRNEADHAVALRRIEQIFDARRGTPELDELEILMTLAAQYEKSLVPAPSPIDAIRFRLQQAGLSYRDLEPYLGSRSKVSEIMSGKRNLTVDMMRGLHLHFGIPAASLLGGAHNAPPPANASAVLAPSAKAIAELLATGLMKSQERFSDFVHRACHTHTVLTSKQSAHFRKTRTDRTNAKTDSAALQGWCAAALLKSHESAVEKHSRKGLDIHVARSLAKISRELHGVTRVAGFLAEHGVALVLLRHLTGTHLDGAAMRRVDGVPVIALTLRHDRIDNFWFTLLHEFAHVSTHLDEHTAMIFDDLELGSSERVEAEADLFAQQALIPSDLWTDIRPDFTLHDILLIADRASIHPAIVAGRWQREHKDYRRFSKLVGHGAVRSLLCDR